MKIFDSLIKEISYKESQSQEHVDSLRSFIKVISEKLLDDDFHPSNALKNLLYKYLRRSQYPMEVAIVGQFSSGKSTFLNALLSKDVLPTGITPVTSKVNFINYGDEYKVKITFKSGATEFHDIEHLAKYTDQRHSTEDIRYLSLYAPVEMLKEISFVDTPGLNSQSKLDTLTTNTILRDVDGIIWLGLIDAVAKKSELDILEKYLPNYANKSICLLNQKDRLSKEDIKTALEYAGENYKDYFSKIVAISAKQALDSRINQKENMLFSERKIFVDDVKHSVLDDGIEVNKDFLLKKLDNYNLHVDNINTKDFAHHLDDLQDSNILEVLEFIDKTIRPKAKEAKIFAIKKDFSSLCEILQNEYTRITAVYAELSEIIEDYSYSLESKLNELDTELSRQVEILNIKINEEIASNVNQIYLNIKPIKKYLILENKSLFAKRYKKEEYQSYFMEDNKLSFIIPKQSLEAMDALIIFSVNGMKNILKDFKKDLFLWQVKNEKLTKNREVASDTEFYNIRNFATGIYEHIVQNYISEFDHFERELHDKIYKVSLKSRFELAYEKTTMQSVVQIIDMQNSYEKNPEQSVINSIDESEILLMFKENLDYEYLKRELRVGDSFVRASVNEYNKKISSAMDESSVKIHINFDTINAKVKLLDEIKDSIEVGF